MIAGQVGEGGGFDRDAVQPILVEAVARRLQGEALNTMTGQLGQRAMKGRWVGCGQAAGPLDPGCAQAERAQRRRRPPQRRPYLTEEGGH